MNRLRPPRDHVAALVELRRKQSPGVDLAGMEILGRARRLTLLSRPRIEAVFARFGLDAGLFDVLATLERAGPPYALTPTELYRTLMISSGGLTDRLDRLEAAGLVAREKSETDRRRFVVRLLPEGRETIAAAFAEDMAVEADMLAALTAEERRSLAGLLARLLAALESADDRAS